VEWDDVKDAVAEQIDTFVNNGGHNKFEENKTKNNQFMVKQHLTLPL
jgi:hypothetical protein